MMMIKTGPNKDQNIRKTLVFKPGVKSKSLDIFDRPQSVNQESLKRQNIRHHSLASIPEHSIQVTIINFSNITHPTMLKLIETLHNHNIFSLSMTFRTVNNMRRIWSSVTGLQFPWTMGINQHPPIIVWNTSNRNDI